MKCIFDENLPFKLAKTLDYLEGNNGYVVRHMTEIVTASTADEDWIRKFGNEGNCFVITKDNKIKKNKSELLAWKESNLTIVFLQDSWFNMEFWDICWKFIKIWPNLKNVIERSANRKTLLIHIQGKVEELEFERPILSSKSSVG